MTDPGSLEDASLYHLATAGDWERYGAAGWIEPSSLAAEGFVHCSWGRQVAGTVRKHFDGVDGLLALRLDPARLGGALVEEDSTGAGQVFPHVYDRIAVDAVTAVEPLT